LRPSGVRELSQEARLRFPIVGIEHADCIDDDVSAERGIENLCEGGPACVVAAVADDDQHLPRPVSLLQSLQSHGDRVEERRLASCQRAVERAAQLLVVARERLPGRQAGPDLFIEMEREDFVRGIAGIGERQSGRDDAVAAALHAAAAVDHQADGDGCVFVLEELNRLRPAVLEHGERLAGKSADEPGPLVDDADAQHDELRTR
jgi:hypothetical protein